MKKLLFILFAIQMMAGCLPINEEIITEINMDIQDKKLQKIFSFQDERKSDSLFQYFWHRDPTYRYPAVMAFASIKDSTALDSIAALLKDPVDEVRAAAAFAIGQIGSSKGELLLFQAFDMEDTIGQFELANAAILEAVGKCGTKKSLEALSSIESYLPTDTALLTGQAYGIYRFGLRKQFSKKGTERMLDLVTDGAYPEEPRYVAANYLARFKDLDLSDKADDLVRSFTKEEDPRIRMVLAKVLGKTESEVARESLLGLVGAEQDYRVKCAMINALGKFEYGKVAQPISGFLKNPNIHVATTAANFFLEHGISREANNYRRIARDTLPWQVQVTMNQAALRHIPPYMEETIGMANYRLRRNFEKTENRYEKAAILNALGEYGWNYRYIGEKLLISDFPVVRSAGIAALAKICEPDRFKKYFGEGNPRIRRDIAATLQEGINAGDVGLIAEAAKLLRNQKMNFRDIIDSTAFLNTALAKLKLPGQTETYNELKQAIHFLNWQPKFKPKDPKFNNKIKWEILSGANEESTATIKTAKGDIQLQLFVNDAPGSVANFTKLARERFFNNKNFHRIVTNFVVQGGCPRGDGYGSLDYSIRSEFSMHHYNDEGYIGMASAGKDTEGTQFFITHAPTPHLDGRYTIFGKVTKGMNVVHSLEIGDQIEKVEIDF